MDNTFHPAAAQRRLEDRLVRSRRGVAVRGGSSFSGLLVGQKLGALARRACSVSRAVMRIKRRQRRRFFLHWVYWHLPILVHTAPSARRRPYLRRMIGMKLGAQDQDLAALRE